MQIITDLWRPIFVGFFTTHLLLVATHGQAMLGKPIFLKSGSDPFPAVEFGGMCGRTWIGPRVALSAAHCTWSNGFSSPASQDEPVRFKISNGVSYFPNTYDNRYFMKGGFGHASRNDIAISIYDQPNLEVKPMNVTCHLPKLGETIYTIGYGRPNVLKKQLGWSTVEEILPHSIRTENVVEKLSVDTFDSGGPNFIIDTDGKWKIFGVTSTGTRLGLSSSHGLRNPSDLADGFKPFYFPNSAPEDLPYRNGIATLVNIYSPNNTPTDPQFCVNRFWADSFWRHVLDIPGVEICGINLDCD